MSIANVNARMQTLISVIGKHKHIGPVSKILNWFYSAWLKSSPAKHNSLNQCIPFSHIGTTFKGPLIFLIFVAHMSICGCRFDFFSCSHICATFKLEKNRFVDAESQHFYVRGGGADSQKFHICGCVQTTSCAICSALQFMS